MDGPVSIVDNYKKHHYDQSELIGMHIMLNKSKIKDVGAVRRGICQTMSIFWIKRKLDELGSKTKHDGKGIMGAIDENFEQIAVLHEVKDYKKFGFNIFGPAEATFGLVKSHSWQDVGTKVSLDLDSVNEIVTGAKKCCYLFTFDCFNDGKNLGGHAIAFYLSSGKMLGKGQHVYVFDPNYGEFKVPKSVFKIWLAELLRLRYGRTDEMHASELIRY